MIKTLNEPVYEVNPESSFYKAHAQKRANVTEINKLLADIENYLEISEETFVYYNAARFGFFGDSDGYKMYKDNLKKNSDSNGVYLFKKTTPEFKYVTELMKQVDELKAVVSPFSAHDIFGFNNIESSQWVDNRMFVGVKNKKYTEEAVKERESADDKGNVVGTRDDNIKYYRQVQVFDVEPVQEVDYVEYLKLITEWLVEREEK